MREGNGSDHETMMGSGLHTCISFQICKPDPIFDNFLVKGSRCDIGGDMAGEPATKEDFKEIKEDFKEIKNDMDKLKEDVSAISKDVAVINVKFETVCTKEELLNVSNNVSLIKKDISGINEKMKK